MSSVPVHLPSPALPSWVRLLALALSLLALTRCSRPAPSTEETTSSVSFAIQDTDVLASGGGAPGRLAAMDVRAQAFTLKDVASIKMSVRDITTDTAIAVNVDLTKNSTDAWGGAIAGLPRGKALLFSASAYSTKTAVAANLLFSATTTQTLTQPNQTVPLALVPVTSGKEVLLPRILLIKIPSTFVSNQPSNINFYVEGSNGATLTYKVDAASGTSGSFSPNAGSTSLGSATTGVFVSQYEPPLVSQPTTFEHSVTVTNAAGHSVTTTFKTNVLPPGKTDVYDARIAILFNPVINALNGRRVDGTTDVIFTATVADNSDENLLTYQWSFSSTETYTPALFMDGTTKVGTLHNYTKDVQGTVTVAVTDPDGGTTTLKYKFIPNQFPDKPYEEGQPDELKSIRAGASHTCALYNRGGVRCWGNNAEGQLGYKSRINYGDTATPLPGDVTIAGKAAQIALGANHTCALLDNGYVTCWGRNRYGQLGYNTTDTVGDDEPVSDYGYVILGGSATKITAGQNHTCALMATGNVRCWGLGSTGQLGYGDTNNIGDDEAPKGDVDLGGVPVLDIVAGAYHTCALLNTRAVRCWGSNAFGQLGQGNLTPIGESKTPATAANINLGGGQVLQIAAGAWHTCVLLAGGNVRCWGLNSSGQLGYGNTADLSLPGSDVPTGGKALQVAAGSDHTCALLESGGVKCWGYGEFGQLGTASSGNLTTPPSAPLALQGATTAYQLTTGAYHSCALLSSGVASCWGLNGVGQLGYGHTQNIGDNEQPSSAGAVKVLVR